VYEHDLALHRNGVFKLQKNVSFVS
jgi:hypothetical protein